VSRRRPLALILVVAFVAVVTGVVWFTGRAQPEAVDIERALAGTASPEPSPPVVDDGYGEDGYGYGAAPRSGSASGTDAAPAQDEVITDATGTWQVVPDPAGFDTLAGTGVWVGYRIDEELSGRGAFTAVGRSPEVSGTVEIDGTQVTAVEIRADLTRLQSDSSTRDSRVRGVFEGREAVFVLTEPFDVGSLPSVGERVRVQAVGTLRIGAVERPVTVDLIADLSGSTLVVVGSTDILLADFDVRVPSAPIVLGVSDTATMELQLRLRRE
jgi:polyisoprenoid-binding protein YceI